MDLQNITSDTIALTLVDYVTSVTRAVSILPFKTVSITTNEYYGTLKIDQLVQQGKLGASVIPRPVEAQNILKDGSVAFESDQSMGSNKIIDLTDPTNAQEAATKAYVDSLAGGGTKTIPMASTESTSVYVYGGSGDYEDISGYSVVLVLAYASKIFANFLCQVSSPASGSCAGDVRLTINSSPVENGAAMSFSINGNNDDAVGAGRLYTTTLPAGTYTITGQFRRTSGGGSLQFNRGTIFALAQTF